MVLPLLFFYRKDISPIVILIASDKGAGACVDPDNISARIVGVVVGICSSSVNKRILHIVKSAVLHLEFSYD